MNGFVKRGLPHTSNSINVEDHSLVSKKHTNLSEKKALQQNLDEISYTCGFMFADLHFIGKLANVHA